jgi:hypothetical protein
MESAMRNFIRAAVLVALVALPACSWVTLTDAYGNSYGGFFDYGNQYSWQLETCQSDPRLAQAAPAIRKRWMECCMWRHGVPIDDAAGCAAPPYFNG